MRLIAVVAAFSCLLTAASTVQVQKPPTELLAPLENFPSIQKPSTKTQNTSTKPTVSLIKPTDPIKSTTPFTSQLKNIKLSTPSAAKKIATSSQTKPTSNFSSKVPKRAVDNSWSNDEITHFERSANPNGAYYYNFKTVNGISMQERGEPKFLDEPSNDISQTQQVEGEYSYIAPDGTEIVMSYIANENGFQPLGAHIPTPPPIPEAILRALNYVRSQQPQ